MKLPDKILTAIELKEYRKLSNSRDDLLEMANIGEKVTGIPEVVIWVGPNPPQHGMRIKVSNIPGKSMGDTITITIPDLLVVGKVNKSFITPEILEKINQWITINLAAITEYSNSTILTEDFLARVQKV